MILLLVYASTFLIFQILRFFTNVSIQRIGISGLRRISYSPAPGLHIRIRGLTLSLHRPTYARPTWLSIVVTEPQIIIDATIDANNPSTKPLDREPDTHDHIWQRLLRFKDLAKLLHHRLHYLRLADIIVLHASATIHDAGSVRVERITLFVDNRSKAVDRTRLFKHNTKRRSTDPVEWKASVKSLLVIPIGGDPSELLDHCTLSIHGLLRPAFDGLDNTSISIKLGRLNVAYDDLLKAVQRARHVLVRTKAQASTGRVPKITINGAKTADHTDLRPVPHSARLLVDSIVHSITEIQIAVAFFGVTKAIVADRPTQQAVFFNMSMKELALDLSRLDQHSPAHRMDFAPTSIAHQALITATSFSAGIDYSHDSPARLLYIPMCTATVRTTLPAVAIAHQDTSSNAPFENLLFANLVCTLPSIDLDPKHLPLLLTTGRVVAADSPGGTTNDFSSVRDRLLLSRILPKANIKVAIQEPVVRISLPRDSHASDYDMIISSVSSMSFVIDAHHDSESEPRYVISLDYTQNMHKLYGQTAAGEKHDLLFAKSIELQVGMAALPKLSVSVTGQYQTLSIFLVKPEICAGIRQIIQAVRKEVARVTNRTTPALRTSFLRRLPAWLAYAQIKGSDFDMELSDTDLVVSKYARGLMFHLESWAVEYKARRGDLNVLPTRHRSFSKSTQPDSTVPDTRQSSPRKRQANPGDGRRLTLHVQGLKGWIIDSSPSSEPDLFTSLPKFETAFSTSTDLHGALFHVNIVAKTFLLYYSLYNHFAIGVAILLLKRTFVPEVRLDTVQPLKQIDAPNPQSADSSSVNGEVTALDFRADVIHVKATMPAAPAMMLDIFDLQTGQHRWANPFLRIKLARLCVTTPNMPSVWSRLVTIKAVRLDVRTTKRKVGNNIYNERSIDIVAEALRISVPHQLTVHAIFDNITSVIKSGAQLHHYFSTDSNEYILAKQPEQAKRVPRIAFRSQLFIFELEDGGFEYQLGTIYRTGLAEQEQRIVREAAFDLKCRRSQHVNRTRQIHKPRMPDTSQTSTYPSLERTESMRKPAESTTHESSAHDLQYDTKGSCQMDGDMSTSVKHAREVLDKYNATSWKERIDESYSRRKNAIRDMRSFFWGMDDTYDASSETIMAINQRPALTCMFISDIALVIDKPSFAMAEVPDFLRDVGKGIPVDTQYGLLIPMHLQVSLAEIRVHLRDYPLPILHIPPIQAGQSPRLPSLSLHADMVIAEEFRDKESQRHAHVVVVPGSKLGPDDSAKQFAIDVRRTISPVKTYSTLNFEINTAAPTRITWGTSYQPAIQDMMQVIEGFTKPAVDLSDRVGFWDKIRLSFHSRISVDWKGSGDVHLNLKGSRDPYIVTGYGAGLTMVWRQNVKWNINQDDDPKKFMKVESGEYLLAVPDFADYARERLASTDAKSETQPPRARSSTMFKKVAMKLSGHVEWFGGLVFEHNTVDGSRGFDFKPHYEVVFKHPDYARAPPGVAYDAFDGFRSHHIHMSLAVAAPHNQRSRALAGQETTNYNSVHLSPRFFTHFQTWWSLFSGVMSLPVRQGPLWTQQEKSSKKFGRHIATIKYNVLMSPVYLSHIYRHKGPEQSTTSIVSATGVKMKFSSLVLDLHQRREKTHNATSRGGRVGRTNNMRINECQLDFVSGDIRAVSSTFDQQVENKSNAEPAAFEIPDNDLGWIDMDDFIDLNCIWGRDADTKILPLATAPRFTYYRQTDHSFEHAEQTIMSMFGREATHQCVMSSKLDPVHVQIELLQDRLDSVQAQMESNHRAEGDSELKLIRDHTADEKLDKNFNALRNFGEHLVRKEAFLKAMLEELSQGTSPLSQAANTMRTGEPDISEDYSVDFNNRFVVHNAQVKWNNALRNIILRYIHQISQRRGFVYYMSRKAVKFILDLIDEQKTAEPHSAFDAVSPGAEDDMTVQDRIEQILADGRAFVDADDPEEAEKGQAQEHNISTEFTAQNSYHFKLIAPQVQLQSDKNKTAAVLITAKGMQLKVVQIMDKDRVLDEVSGLVQRRFSATMDSLQVFVTSAKTFSTDFLHMYAGNRYGSKTGSSWPPWVPIEVMYEFEITPYGFSRVVQPTSASLRYDKFNTLRLKYNDDVARQGSANVDRFGQRMDHLWIEFPEVRAICDSLQYFAMYVIVVDLLLYTEPTEKSREERLEKIMLASDFSDLTGAPEMVQTLQDGIHQLEEIQMQHKLGKRVNGQQSHEEGLIMDKDLTNFEDELFFMMKAITSSQQRAEERNVQDAATGVLRRLISAKHIAWHLVKEKDASLLEFQLRDCIFDRTDNNDGSNTNCIEIGLVNGYNLLPHALYPQIISPYSTREARPTKMLRVNWLMLEAIAGIPVVDYFEVDLVPLRVQLEQEIAKEIFEYIFPSTSANGFDGPKFSAFQPKQQKPSKNSSDSSEEEATPMDPTSNDKGSRTNTKQRSFGQGTGTGGLDQRLTPTLDLQKPKSKSSRKSGFSTPVDNGNSNGRSLFSQSNRSQSDSLRSPPLANALRSTTSQVSLTPSAGASSSVDNGTKQKRNYLRNSSSKDANKINDDLSQMVDRASSYITLSVFKVHSLELCLSYKGRGQRNLEDVHDLLFRLPMLEYRNKTWSNLDLALQVKKDVIRALISHAGAIVGNKFTHHRPSKSQQARIRDLANSNLIMDVSRDMPESIASSSRPNEKASETGSSRETTSHDQRRSAEVAKHASDPASPRTSLSSIMPVATRPSASEGPLATPPKKHGIGTHERSSVDVNAEHSSPKLGNNAVSRRLTDLGQRIRSKSEATDGDGDAGDVSRRKSRLVSGGQKLLSKLG